MDLQRRLSRSPGALTPGYHGCPARKLHYMRRARDVHPVKKGRHIFIGCSGSVNAIKECQGSHAHILDHINNRGLPSDSVSDQRLLVPSQGESGCMVWLANRPHRGPFWEGAGDGLRGVDVLPLLSLIALGVWGRGNQGDCVFLVISPPALRPDSWGHATWQGLNDGLGPLHDGHNAF